MTRDVRQESLHCLDAGEFLDGLEPESVDLLLTDPPYESLEKHRAVGTTTRLKHSKQSSNDWFQIIPNHRFPALFRQMYRVMARNSHLYLHCDQETMFVIKSMGEQAGFRFWKPLVWDKMVIGMGYHYRARYEFILFFEKGKRRLQNLSIPDVLSIRKVTGRDAWPTQKPVALARILIDQSSSPGQLVVDPFMGSGTTGVAAIELGRHFAGCDIDPAAIERAVDRIGTAVTRAKHPERKERDHGETPA